MDDWIKKMWCTLTVAYYSAMRKKETLASVTTWVGLEGTVPSEVSQTRQTVYDLTHMWNLKESWTCNNREWNGGSQGLGVGGNGERLFKGTFLHLEDEYIPEI